MSKLTRDLRIVRRVIPISRDAKRVEEEKVKESYDQDIGNILVKLEEQKNDDSWLADVGLK
ncbi:hypothetical protein [Fictibacillus fluitans]|uniref:Uncharacterized protein n=1 Tax=Fictibacillus fluitans TaxID=3058422 RepID=A0ABT8HV87_9BACL|nr:hypothetical protein [Fictibacillus sp. NE201]MDN4524405.1 hypothetical protein [Fictibacillus sp. NE201]